MISLVDQPTFSRSIEPASTDLGLRPARATETAEANRPGRVQFSDVLAEAVDALRGTFAEADGAVKDAMLGQGTPHHAMLKMSQADIAFRFATQTRNKLVDAYREMMSLQM